VPTLAGSAGGNEVGEVCEGVILAVPPLGGPPAHHPDPGKYNQSWLPRSGEVCLHLREAQWSPLNIQYGMLTNCPVCSYKRQEAPCLSCSVQGTGLQPEPLLPCSIPVYSSEQAAGPLAIGGVARRIHTAQKSLQRRMDKAALFSVH
jgi:hypothetical protein